MDLQERKKAVRQMIEDYAPSAQVSYLTSALETYFFEVGDDLEDEHPAQSAIDYLKYCNAPFGSVVVESPMVRDLVATIREQELPVKCGKGWKPIK